MRSLKLPLLIIFSFFLITASCFSQTFKPNHLSGLALWLRADSNVVHPSTVTTWKDCSGNGDSLTQSTTSAQPTYLSSNPSINNLPSIYFDGNDYLNGGDILDLQNFDITVFCLIKTTVAGNPTFFAKSNYTGASGHYTLGAFGTSFGFYYNPYTTNTAPPLGTYNICTVLLNRSAGNTTIRMNGAIFKSLNYTPESSFWDNALPFCVGSSSTGAYNLNGEITELIYYNRLLNTTERDNVEQYLQTKYAKRINLGPDIIIPYGFNDTVLNAGSGFTNYLWKDSSTSQTLTVSKSGTYWVQANDVFSMLTKDTINVTYPNTKLNFSNDTTICLGNTLSIHSVISNPSLYKFLWSNGDTTSTVNVSTQGYYWVKITDSLNYFAYSDTIFVAVDSFSTKVSLGPDISFCSGNSISLIPPLPNPLLLNYTWSDNSHDTLLVVNTSGNYKVTVTNGNACTGKDTILVTITGTAPNTLFYADTVCLGENTHFTNASTYTGLDSIVRWHWVFTASDTSNSKNPVFLFLAAGPHIVSLTTQTVGGCSKTYLKNVLVRPAPYVDFTNDFTCISNSYQFNNLSSVLPGDSIISWDWDFGDGTAHSYIKNPFHTYTSADTFNVTLSIQTMNGCIKSLSKPLIVVATYPFPDVFILTSPLNNIYISDTNVYFSWQASQNANHYQIVAASDSLFASIIFSANTDSLHYHYNFPNVYQKIFWKVNAYNICSNSIVSEIRKFYIFSPLYIGGTQLWLKADAGVTTPSGNIVSEWTDLSDNGYGFIQNNPTKRPTIVDSALNNYPVIHFDGTDDYLNGGNVLNIGKDSWTHFVVAKNSTASGTYFAKANASGAGNRYGILYISGTLYNMYYDDADNGSVTTIRDNNDFEILTETIDRDQTKVKAYANFNFIGEKSPIKDSNYNLISDYVFLLGAYNNDAGTNAGYFFLNGDIAEIISYNKILSNADRRQIEHYLSYKYAGPPVDLGPDVNIAYGMCDFTLDAGGRFTNYHWSTGDTTQTINITQSGQYWVEATNIFEELSRDTINVAFPSITVQDTAFCLGSSVVVSGNLGSSYTYLWLPDGVTSDTFAITQPGNYSLTVYDTSANACHRTKSFTVTADSFAVIASLGPDKKICKGDYIGLVSGAQEAISYLWSDNSGGSSLIINDNYGTNPVYSVTVSNDNYCVAHDTIVLNVNGVKPLASFVSDSVCFGVYTNFTDLSSVVFPFQISNHFWNFGDSTTSLATNPVHLFSNDGYYQVNLTVTTDSGCVASIQKTVKVFSMPAVNFLPFEGCSGKNVDFINNTICNYGNITEWHWDFGDTLSESDTSNIQNPSYTYDSSGTFIIKLIAVSQAGCTDSLEHIINIKQSPLVDFSYSNACASQTVYFTDQTIIPVWETITSIEWDFGDGTETSIFNPSHSYDSAGTYNAKLTIKILNGCEVSLTKQIIIGNLPVASFGFSNNCTYNSTQFTDSSTITQGIINYWSWSFGESGTSSTQNPGFVFPDTGIYMVNLFVKTDHECTDSITIPVRVYPAPKAEFTFTPEYGIHPLPVTFNNLSTGANSFTWDFGDSFTDVSINPVHTYQSQGIFDVLLTAYSTIGCYDTVSHKVFVLPTTVDLLVSNTTSVLNGNILDVSADLMNIGSRKIEHIDVAVQIENGNKIHEQWYGSLKEGESVHYVFASQIEIPAGINADFVCVTASLLPELEENILSNDQNCSALSSSFVLSEPYPNPLINNLVIVYILPFKGNVQIELFDEMGNKVKELFNDDRLEGYNAQTFDLSFLNSGVYTFKLTFHDNALRKKFVKQ